MVPHFQEKIKQKARKIKEFGKFFLLRFCFSAKYTKNSQYKNRLFDEMHKQLMKYQDDVLQSVMEPVILEIISLLDGIKKYERFIPEEVTAENYGKLKKRFTDIRGDLEDLLEDMDVSKYETDDTVLDAKRQKIIKTVLTDDTAKNNTIESKLSDGYIFKNKIIKYEKVSVYKIK